jgi:UDP-N-acetyl-2-amino-2-deoxyglucuronate dehydrogenase
LDKVGLAVIGSTGVIGQVHIDAISKLESCRLVGVNARRQEPLRQQAKELKVARYATLDEVMEDPAVDAIIIATPHPSHMDITIQAAEAGKHVLVEKPMSVTPSEADAMIAAVRKAGIKLGVLFNNRFRPEALKARQLIDQGAIGKIYRTSMVSAMLRSQDYYDRLDWRGTWELEGGGALINQGIHGIDMFQWLGGMPQTVCGMVRTLKHRIEVEDYASAVLEYAGGAHGTLHCSTVQARTQQRFELWGDGGAIILDNWKLTLYSLDTPVQEFIDTDRNENFSITPDSHAETFEFEPVGSTHVPAIDDFARAILEDREPAISGEDGLKSQELVAAITLSGCRANSVQLPVDRQQYDSLLDELRTSRRLPNSDS